MQQWMRQMRTGLLELCVMGHLAQGQSYGYQLAQIIFDDNPEGIHWGTLYPILARFRRQGWVSAHKGYSPLGPKRLYYHLTPAGERRFKLMANYWRRTVRTTEKALKAAP